jgi:hypothetical protein
MPGCLNNLFQFLKPSATGCGPSRFHQGSNAPAPTVRASSRWPLASQTAPVSQRLWVDQSLGLPQNTPTARCAARNNHHKAATARRVSSLYRAES